MGTNEPLQPDSLEPSEQPGKTRTPWHPLLARLLDFALSSAYTVVPEVHVGKMPLRVDILLVRREGGELPEAKRREVPALLPLLNRFTLIEFKGPTDSLERGDFAQLLGCAFLWHSQQSEAVPRENISLLILAPTITGPLRDELQLWGCSMSEGEPGIFHVTGLPMAVWLVETDAMARSTEPVLSLVSRVFLREHRSIIEELTHEGYSGLTWYAVQLMHQINTHREDFAVPTGAVDEFAKLDVNVLRDFLATVDENVVRDFLASLDEKLVRDFLATLPDDLRLRGLSPEEVLRGLSPEEVLRVLTPEELAAAMTDEQAARLRELLDRRQHG
jgi:hypothetical protein